MSSAAQPLTRKQRWYRVHRDTELSKAKDRARRKREERRAELRLSPEELARCQADPTLTWTIRGSKWIACIEDDCGALCEQLGPHLWTVHNMTGADYKRRPAPDGVTPRY